MQNIINIIENTNWKIQLLYGLILALFFGGVTLLSGFSPVWAIAQIVLISAVREHYLQDLTGKFNWRNFFFVLVPVLLLYIIFF